MSFSKIKNPDVFGELIRDLAFKKEDEYSFGCYSTFDMEEEFKIVEPDSKLGQRLLGFLMKEYLSPIRGVYVDDKPDAEDVGELRKLSSLYSNGACHLAWYWDGDGTLLVSDGDRFAINDDCKKDYNWMWIE